MLFRDHTEILTQRQSLPPELLWLLATQCPLLLLFSRELPVVCGNHLAGRSHHPTNANDCLVPRLVKAAWSSPSVDQERLNFSRDHTFFLFFPKFGFFFFFSMLFPQYNFFPTAQHGDPVTHTCIHSFFSYYHAPS